MFPPTSYFMPKFSIVTFPKLRNQLSSRVCIKIHNPLSENAILTMEPYKLDDTSVTALVTPIESPIMLVGADKTAMDLTEHEDNPTYYSDILDELGIKESPIVTYRKYNDVLCSISVIPICTKGNVDVTFLIVLMIKNLRFYF